MQHYSQVYYAMRLSRFSCCAWFNFVIYFGLWPQNVYAGSKGPNNFRIPELAMWDHHRPKVFALGDFTKKFRKENEMENSTCNNSFELSVSAMQIKRVLYLFIACGELWTFSTTRSYFLTCGSCRLKSLRWRMASITEVPGVQILASTLKRILKYF